MRGIPYGFPAQMTSNTENAYIWWRHLESHHPSRERLYGTRDHIDCVRLNGFYYATYAKPYSKQFVDKRYTHLKMNKDKQFHQKLWAIAFTTLSKYDQAFLHIPDSWYLPHLTVIFSVTDILMGELCPGVCITPEQCYMTPSRTI